MSNFVRVAFIDASYCTAAYTTRYKARLQPSLDGEMEAIQLMRDGKPSSILGEWRSAKALISKIRNSAAPFFDGRPAMIEAASIISLGVNKRLSWKDPEGDSIWAMMCLLPSPGAMIFSGIESASPPVGQLFALSRALPFSAINLGPVPAVWITVDARLPDAIPVGTD